MNPIRAIRLHVFRCSQSDLARATGIRQSVISRWESGILDPRLADAARIRAEAMKRGLPWNDGWFFEPPAERDIA